MAAQGYSETALVSNRTSLLLHGGSEAERRAWAEEAASNFEAEGPLRVASDDAQLTAALSSTRGVVFIPDVSAISTVRQGEVVRILREREERPKFVIGLGSNPVAARDQGRIRWDLSYVLQIARVNLDEPGLKEAIRSRRALAPKRPAAPAPSQASRRARPPEKSPRTARPAGKTAKPPSKSAARKGR